MKTKNEEDYPEYEDSQEFIQGDMHRSLDDTTLDGEDMIGLDIKQLKPKKARWILRNNSPLKVKWDLIIMLLATWNCFTIPVNVAYNPIMMQHWMFDITNSLIDILFLIDIAINFRTSFIH